MRQMNWAKAGFAGIILFITLVSSVWASAPSTPVFTPAGGTYYNEQEVVITCATEGATIRYSADGSDPNSGTELISGTSVLIDHSLTLQAVAWKDGVPSSPKSATYNLVVAIPIFSPNGGIYYTEQTVTISCATLDAIIHYTTNGLDPTESDSVIASGSSLTVDQSMTLKAKAWKGGWTASNVRSVYYEIDLYPDYLTPPYFLPDGGTYNTEQDVVITCYTPGATIYYTIDGSDPNTGIEIASGDSIHIDHSLILGAVAWKDGEFGCPSYASYKMVVATPVLAPEGGVYDSDQTVVVTCSDAEATLHYTTDGSDPTESDPIVENGESIVISVGPATILNVCAFRTGWYSGDKAAVYSRNRYSGGSGTLEDPYQIASKTDLLSLEIWGDHDKCFILTKDIDLEGQVFTTAIISPDEDDVDSDFRGIPFAGIFNGNGHKIMNFTINGGTNNSYTYSSHGGLFGCVSSGGRIENLGLENCEVSDFWIHVGALAGQNSGYINNCYSIGIVSGSIRVGGLVGKTDGYIDRCYTVGTVSGSSYTGGLVGYIYGGIVSNSYSLCTVSASSGTSSFCIAGLAGFIWNATISKCYAAGLISGPYSSCDGLVGESYFSSVANSFWDTQTSGRTISDGGGTGKTTAQMKTLTTFTNAGWDFASVWDICEGTNYPRLLWQIPEGDWVCPDGVNVEDLDYLVEQWLETTCTTDNDYCDGVDLDESGTVDMSDLAVFARNWLMD